MNRFVFFAALVLFLGGCAGNPEQQALKRGIRALEKGNYQKSILWFQRSLAGIASNEERSIVLNCLGISYHRLGQKKNALEKFAESSAANPGALEPVYNMGIVFFETGDEDKAIASFEKAALLCESARAQGRPEDSAADTRALEFLAVIYSQRRQWDDAQRVLNEAAQDARFSPRILTALAVTEVKTDNINRALELLQEVLERDAHYAPAIYNLAVINQHYLNKHDQALPLFAEYARLVPAGPQTDQAHLIIKEIKDKRPPAPLPAAKTESRLPPSAAVTTETAVAAIAQPQKNAAAGPVIFPSFEELMQVAEKLEQQGRSEAAFNNYLRIARAAEQAGKTSIMNQAIRHAVTLAEGEPQATYDLGVYFAERNKKDKALLYFKSAVDQDINPYPAAMALAKLALEKNEFDTAIVSLKKADQIKPVDPEALWLLAELYDRQLCITNSAASTYNQFLVRFPKDRRAPDALNRLKAMKFEFKPPQNGAVGQNKRSRPFWQRMFKDSVTNFTEESKVHGKK